MTVVATEGRTFTIKSLELDPEIASGRKFPANGRYTTGADYHEVETPYVVPNGKWVASWPSASWAKLVGADWSEIESVTLDTRYGGMSDFYSTLYICDRPFGFVRKDMPWGNEYVDGSNAYRSNLTVARQIHKGELGRTVPIPRIDYVRQPFGTHQKLSVTKAHQRRRGYGWVKLADLGEVTVGYNPDKVVELILGYWKFSGHLCYYNHKPDGTLVDTVWGSSLDIQLGDVEVVSMTQGRFRREAGADTSEMWIRRGFAFTILRLQALGVEPTIPQSV